MDETRRRLIGAGIAGCAALALPGVANAQGRDEDYIPPIPERPTPGNPGDFDFLAGEWRIAHRMLRAGTDQWDEFTGEATCWTILAGVGSVEELRIPARGFSGMGLRMLDVSARTWSDFWVNARSGVLTTPGQTGSFENGIGLFTSTFEENGRSGISAGIWDRITPLSCRWRQAASYDGGRTWAHSWYMDWRKA